MDSADGLVSFVWITLRSDSITEESRAQIEKVARMMMPWRKGPFDLFGLKIDSEWRSFKKYNLLRPYLDLENKRVADVGCNNGYYMFRIPYVHSAAKSLDIKLFCQYHILFYFNI